MSEAEIDEKYRALIRGELDMIDGTLEQFNTYTLNFVNVEDLRQKISDIRWYVSHNYFEKGRPQPDKKQGKSSPPISWLYSAIHGRTVPISTDLGRCIEPVVRSSLETQHAAQRIFNALTYPLYNYVSEEDAKADQEAAYKRNVVDKMDLKKKADYERERWHREQEKKKAPTPEQLEKSAERYMERKNRQRQDACKLRDEAKKRGDDIYDAESRRLKKNGNKA